MTDPTRHIRHVAAQSHLTGISPIAVQVPDLRRDPPRKRRPFGLCVHTSGRGIVKRAHRAGIDPVEFAVAYYQEAKYSAGYVIGWDGTIYQIGSDMDRYSHIGVSAEERVRYLSGGWVDSVPTTALDLWLGHWRHCSSPQHIFPWKSANDCYLGAECIPLPHQTLHGLWYTERQHAAVARLYLDRAKVYGWGSPDMSSGATLPFRRLLGHEDLDAYGRWDSHGGWDPGALRAKPRFCWRTVGLYLRRG